MSDQPPIKFRCRVAYADPPYPGCAHLYCEHEDYDGEVDHLELARTLCEYDGWCLHTTSTALHYVQRRLAIVGLAPPDPFSGFTGDYRIMSWVKPFAAFKANVSVAYAWEPVLVRSCRKPVVSGRQVMRDFISEPITLKRGLTGAKPEAVCRWLFEVMGMEPDDELVDLYRGTGAVSEAWDAWRAQLRMAV